MTRDPVRARLFSGLLVAALLVVVVVHVGMGPGGDFTAMPRTLAILFGMGGEADRLDRMLVFDYRVPRLLVGAFGGAALGIAGAVMQAAFRNALASPEVVGTAAGAALGAATAIVAGAGASSALAVPLSALAGATLVTWIVFMIAGTGARFSTAGLLLAGIALSTLAGALTTFVVTLKFDNYSASSSVLFWLMGGLEAQTWPKALITSVGCIVFAVPVWLGARDLDLLTLRDDTAHSLGLDAVRARRWLLWYACGLTGATVANTGGIAFLGLVVPHLARLLVGPAHRALLPAAAATGALLLLAADLLCRCMPISVNLRLGVVTSALGAPFFLFLLLRHRRGEAIA